MNLFLFTLCIISRFTISYLAYKKNIYISYFALILSIAFFLLYFEVIKRDKGPEVSDKYGNVIWWKKYRIVHAINYFLFFIL